MPLDSDSSSRQSAICADFDEQKAILADALASFDMRVAELPAAQRKVVLARLYRNVTDCLFDSHLEVLKSRARENVAKAPDATSKRDVFSAFQAELKDLAQLYGVR